MSFNLDLDLYLDIDAPEGLPCLLNGKTSATRSQTLALMQGDVFPLNLYFRRRTSLEAASVAVELDALNIILAGKLLDSLSSTTLLLEADSFVPVGTGDDLHYQAVLNLDKTEIATALTSAKSVTVRCNLELQNPGNTQRMTFRFDATIEKQSYGGESSPTPATPTYPLPALLVTKIRGTVALTSGQTVISVTGLNLPSVPAQILTGLRKPTAGADNILIGGVADDSITVDGFSVALAAAVPASGYKLDWLIIL